MKGKAPRSLKDFDFSSAVSEAIALERGLAVPINSEMTSIRQDESSEDSATSVTNVPKPQVGEGASQTAPDTNVKTKSTEVVEGNLSAVVRDLESAEDDNDLAHRMTSHVNAVVNQIHVAFEKLMSDSSLDDVCCSYFS